MTGAKILTSSAVIENLLVKSIFTLIGRNLRLVEENNPKILGIKIAKQGSQQNYDSQVASSR
jgi:hypothetical protein